MDYEKHYNQLIERAQNRSLTTYTENHHVIPRCLGGGNEKENIVALTPEEHYVAHQLLVKIHPKESKLIYAANMMTVEGGGNQRSNKRYGWLKRRYISACRERTGSQNPSYGKSWYHHPETLENGKFLPDDIPNGWVKGRRNRPHNQCKVCGCKLESRYANYCKTHRPKGKPPINQNIWYNQTNFNLLYALYDRYANGEQMKELAKEYDKSERAFFYDMKRIKESSVGREDRH